ncbi:MAG: hypothetical protein IJ485_02880 [Lachnospiraceae bacterium]|nr:hypothetical protein [Lachnospiraceae bacterium]
MTEREWMQEGIDGKLLFLLFIRKLWIVLLSVAVGTIITTAIYMLTHVVYAPAREYRAQYKYYLEFNVDENGDVYQHYNDYTWNSLMKTDEIQGYSVELLGDVPAEIISDAVYVEPLSDIRLLSIVVTTTDQELTQRIADATEQSMLHFVDVMKEFKGVEVMQRVPSSLVVVELDTLRVAVAGAVAGFVISVLALLLYFALDDSIYIPIAFQKRYGYPVLGMTFADGWQREANEKQRKNNIAYQRKYLSEINKIDIDKIAHVTIGDLDTQLATDYAKLRTECDAVILKVPYGKRNGKLIEKQITELLNYNLIIIGAEIEDINSTLFHQYYMMGRKKAAASAVVIVGESSDQ